MNLSDFVEEISDDFQSTFTVVNEHTLSNLMWSTEQEEIAEIIHKYLPDVKVKFRNTNELKSDYDIWIIEAK